MRQDQNWIYTKQGDHWYVLSSGILRLAMMRLQGRMRRAWTEFVESEELSASEVWMVPL